MHQSKEHLAYINQTPLLELGVEPVPPTSFTLLGWSRMGEMKEEEAVSMPSTAFTMLL